MRIIAFLLAFAVTPVSAQVLSPSTNPNSITGNLTITGKFLSSAPDSITVPIYSSTQDSTTGLTPRSGELDFIISGSRQGLLSSAGVLTVTGNFSAQGIVITGGAPSNIGSCAITSQLGGATTGSFVASGACAAGTYILGFGFSTTNGWACDAEDRTTITDTVQQIASTATNATFRATTASGDVVSWKCNGF